MPLGIEPGAPDRALVDPRRLSQMLINLLENADNYAGGPTAMIVSGNDTVVRFAVEDRGPGVPEHERHHIFERFARGESSAVPGRATAPASACRWSPSTPACTTATSGWSSGWAAAPGSWSSSRWWSTARGPSRPRRWTGPRLAASARRGPA